MKKLTDKQKRFCEEYIIDLNGTRAYKAAYTSVKKDETAAANAARLLRYAKVQEYIQKLKDERSKRTEITADMVLKEYAKLAFLNPKQFFNDDGSLKPISELDDDTAAAIAGLEVKDLFDKEGPIGTLHKLKIADKKGALDSIAKHLGMFIERKEVSGPNGGPVQTRAEIVDELLDSVDGVTRGLPKPRSDK